MNFTIWQSFTISTLDLPIDLNTQKTIGWNGTNTLPCFTFDRRFYIHPNLILTHHPKLSDSWALQAANQELRREGKIEAHIGMEHMLRSKDAMVDLFHSATYIVLGKSAK